MADMPLRTPLVIAALLLPTLVAAAAPQPALEAQVRDGLVSLEVRDAVARSEMTLVLTHEDPILGAVVDRVVPVRIEADGRARVDLGDLRADVNFTVRLLEPWLAVREVEGKVAVLDGAGARALPSVAEVALDVLGPGVRGPSTTLRGGTVSDGDATEAHRAVVTGSGHVVVGFFERASRRLALVVSADGGKSFGPAIAIVESTGPSVPWWSLHEGPDGGAVVAYKTWRETGDGPRDDPWMVARLDPREGTLRRSEIRPAEANFSFAYGAFESTALPDGSALVAYSGTVEEFDADGHEIRSPWTAEPGIAVFRLGTGGDLAFLTRIRDPPEEWPAEFRLVSNDEGLVAVVLTTVGAVRPDGPTTADRAFTAFSTDGGRTFLPYFEIPGGFADDEILSLRSAALDDSGTVHAAFTTATLDPVVHRALYARATIAGASTVRDLPAQGDASFPVLAAEDSRVWIAWGNETEAYLAESVTSGATFGPTYRVEAARAGWRTAALDADTLPDGRPLLLASSYGFDEASRAFRRVVEAAPLFDPAPLGVPAPRAAVTIEHAPEAPPDPDRALLAFALRNVGPSRLEDVAVEVRLPEGVLLAGPLPGPFDLAPGERLALALPVVDVRAGGGEAEVVAVAGGARGTPARIPIVRAYGVSAAPLPGSRSLLDAEAALPVVAGAAAVAGTAALLGTEAGRFGLGGLLASLYTRLRASDVLRQEVRAAVFAFVGEHPGSRFEEIRRELALGSGALAFHLRVLEREGYVAARREWTRRRFYAAGKTPPASTRPAAPEAVSKLLASTPGLTQAEVARALGVSRQLAQYHLRALERQGLVAASREGRRVRYRAKP